MKAISIKEIVSLSWAAFKEHWALLWAVLIISIVVSGILSYLSEESEGKSLALSIVLVLASLAVSLLIQLGIVRITLDLADQKGARVRQIIGDHTLLLRLLGASILYSLIVLVGLVLLIVPGIIWSIKYGQYKYLIVDKRLGVFDSIKKSGEITMGSKMDLFLLGLVLGLLFVVSIIPLGLGLIATIPMLTIAPAFVYRKLTSVQSGTATLQATTEEGETPPVPPFTPLSDTTPNATDAEQSTGEPTSPGVPATEKTP